MLSPREQLAVISRRTVDVITPEELLAKLSEGRPLRVKYGIDPTGPDVTLGHAVPLRKLRQFQDLGHKAVLIVGDFTAMIGDPSGRVHSRPPLTRAQIEANMATYREQLFKIVDPDPQKVEFRYNGEWLSTLNAEQIIRLAATHTVARMLERQDFAERHRAGQPIGIHEFLYPLLQAYDSVVVQADVELGGTEQLYSFLVARELQRAGVLAPPQPPQAIATLPILVGTDGVQRMGKSIGNYIGVSFPPDEMLGKVMSIPDQIIVQYYELLTDTPDDHIAEMARRMHQSSLNPRDAKLELARQLVTYFHGEKAAEQAVCHWERRFGRLRDSRSLAELAPEAPLPASRRGERIWVASALADLGLAPTRSEARRLVAHGAVWVGDRRVTDPQEEITLEEGLLVRVGRRRLARVTFTDGDDSHE